ncbi:MAG: hypothetical protein M0P71_01295 [Melioribacteraceae bacterium]|nr:hypothetical protein [Melioribacteraceae bacterium]
MSEELKNKEEKEEETLSVTEEEVKSQICNAIKNDELRKKANASLTKARKNLGLIALEEKKYKPENTLEELIHAMKWEPEVLFECTLQKLLEYESVLVAHVLWVRARENKWNCAKKMSERSLNRALMLAAKHCIGKTIKEREAMAMDKFEDLRTAENIQDVHNLYSEQCNGLAESFVQMDNCLKRIIDTRKFEMDKSRNGA